MKKARILSVISVLIVLCMMLGACSAGGDTTAAPSQPSAAQSSAPAGSDNAASSTDATADAEIPTFPLAEPLDIKVYTVLMSKFAGSVDNLRNVIVFDVMKELTNVNFEFEHASASIAAEQYGLMFASGDYADVIAMYRDTYYPGGLGAAYKDGIIISLNDIIDKGYAPWYSAILEAYPNIRSEQAIDGLLLEFAHLSDPNAVCSSGPIIRTDLLEQFGLEVPTTLQEWEYVLYAFKANGVEIPLALDNGIGNLQMGMFAGSLGIGYKEYLVDGEVRYGTIQPEFKELLTMLSKWYADGILDPDFVGTDQTTVRSKVVEGRVGAICGARGGIMQNALNAIFEQNPEDTFWLECQPWPAQNNGEESVVVSKGTVTNNGWSITSACENPELVALALDWFYSADGYIARNYGREGEHWNYNDEGLVQTWVDNGDGVYTKLTDSIPVSLNASKSSYSAMYFDMEKMDFVDIDTVVAPVPLSNDKLTQMKDLVSQKSTDANYMWTKSAAPYNMPVLNLTIEESTEYANIMTTVETYVSEMVAQFILGYESLDNFDAFVQTQKDMGIERAIQIQQEAYNRKYGN